VGDNIEKNGMDGACSAHGEGKNVYRGLVRKPEGKKPMRRPRCRWDDLKMHLQEVAFGGMGSAVIFVTSYRTSNMSSVSIRRKCFAARNHHYIKHESQQ
jgi:hypothetical protein